MKPLFTEEEFEKAKSYDKLSCECYQCKKPFLVEVRYIKDAIKGKNAARFCNLSCSNSFKIKNSKKPCPTCGREITHNNYNLHTSKCTGKISKKIEKYKNSNGEYECPYCFKIYPKLGIGTHVFIHENPTKYTGYSTENLKESYKNGRKKTNQHIHAKETGIPYVIKESTRIKQSIAGSKQIISEERKQKIREQKIKLYQEHPEKIPFNMYKYYEKSYPEKVFETGLSSNTITNYVYDYKKGIYYYDFAFPELQIDFEVDGDMHKKPEHIIKDNLRDEFSLNNGWSVVRFEARLVLKNINYCIGKVKEILQNPENYKGVVTRITYKDYLLFMENKKADTN